MKKFVSACLAALVLASSALPAAAAQPQKFWVVNMSHLDIWNVYVDGDTSGGTRDLMGANGILTYKPYKVPDLVQVLRPVSNTCWSSVTVVGYDQHDNDYYTTFSKVNICTPGLTLNVSDRTFGYR